METQSRARGKETERSTQTFAPTAADNLDRQSLLRCSVKFERERLLAGGKSQET